MHAMKITRTGTVKLTKNAIYDCGNFIQGTAFNVKYNVTVVCEPALDRKRDFLFEHSIVHDAMENLNARTENLGDYSEGYREEEAKSKLNGGSLERLLLRATDSIVSAVRADNPDVRISSITVGLNPAPHDVWGEYQRDFAPTTSTVSLDTVPHGAGAGAASGRGGVLQGSSGGGGSNHRNEAAEA